MAIKLGIPGMTRVDIGGNTYQPDADGNIEVPTDIAQVLVGAGVATEVKAAATGSFPEDGTYPGQMVYDLNDDRPKWRNAANADWTDPTEHPRGYSTASIPAAGRYVGEIIYDSTTKKLYWWFDDGVEGHAAWYDAAGVALGA